MFEAENLRDWRGQKVIDPQGDRIGDLAAGEEPGVFGHYQLPYQVGAGGARRLARR